MQNDNASQRTPTERIGQQDSALAVRSHRAGLKEAVISDAIIKGTGPAKRVRKRGINPATTEVSNTSPFGVKNPVLKYAKENTLSKKKMSLQHSPSHASANLVAYDTPTSGNKMSGSKRASI